MTSVLRNFAQRDNRVESVPLTGYVNDNGLINGQDIFQHPAYAEIDLRKAKTFTIDSRVLTLRTDITPVGYFVKMYLGSVKPPAYYENFEFDIVFTLPDSDGDVIYIDLYENKADAEDFFASRLYRITNVYPNDSGSTASGTQIVTFKSVNNKVVLKSASYGLFP